MWDTVLGCPNNCNGEEQARQRKAAEEARRIQEAKDKAKQAALEYSTSAEAMAAVKRSRENQELTRLRVRQVEERDRFLAFEQKQKWALWTRHGQDKVHMIDSHVTQEQKMKDRVSLYRYDYIMFNSNSCWLAYSNSHNSRRPSSRR